MLSRYMIARKSLTIYALQVILASCMGSNSNKVKPSTKASAIKTVIGTLGPNTAPSLMDLNNLTIDEDSVSPQISLTISDPDGPNQICNSQFLSYTSDQQTIVSSNHAVTWGGDWPNCTAIIVPEKNSSGSTLIEFAASDGSEKGASKTLVLTINPVNDGPSLVTRGETTKTIEEDSPGISVDLGTFLDIDTSQDQLFFLTSLPPSKGSIDSFPSISATEPNSINYVPAANANGVDTFEYKVCDGTNASAKCTDVYNVSINIGAINDAPEMSEILPQITTEDIPKTVSFVGYDVDGDLACSSSNLIYSSSSASIVAPSGGVIWGGIWPNCTATITPVLNAHGNVTLTFMVTDDAGLSSSRSFSFVVTPENDSPTISNIQNQEFNESLLASELNIMIDDVDDTISCTTALSATSSNPTLLDVSNIAISGAAKNCRISILPTATQYGSSTVTLSVNDGTSLPTTRSFIIYVNALPKISTSTSQSTIEGQAKTGISVIISDDDGPLTCSSSIVASSSNPTLVLSSKITFSGTTPNCLMSITPENYQLGTTNILLTVRDNKLAETTKTLVLDVFQAIPTLHSSTLNGLHFILEGTCDSRAHYAYSASTDKGRVILVTCQSETLKVFLTDLPQGKNDVTVSVTSAKSPGNETVTSSKTFHQYYFCPDGYVGIPGKFEFESDTIGLGLSGDGTNSDSTGYARAGRSDSGLDPTKDFCIMKYPAKAVISSVGSSSTRNYVPKSPGSTSIFDYLPDSRALGEPWGNISKSQAQDRCLALNEANQLCTTPGCYSTFDYSSYGYRLATNTQWQVLARNLELQAQNWTGGIVGVGKLFKGISSSLSAQNKTNNEKYSIALSSGALVPLGHPLIDSDNYTNFGSTYDFSQSGQGFADWENKRRFILSNENSIWDASGNVAHWVSTNISSLGFSSSDYSALLSGWNSFLSAGINRFTGPANLIFGGKGSGGVQYSENQNAGKIFKSTTPTDDLLRGSLNFDSNGGIFGTYYGYDSVEAVTGFRCSYIAPPISSDINPPTFSLEPSLVTVNGTGTLSTPITIENGGLWNLGWAVVDLENTGTDAHRIYYETRRKVSSSATDFPSISDEIYQAGFALNVLRDETSWTQNSETGIYTTNDSKYVNYRISAIDPAGNTTSTTVSIQVSKSCPPGYIGVPGTSIAGLGNSSASVNHTNLQLDPSRTFCVMKYPAKVKSSHTSIALSTVGAKSQYIEQGENEFPQISTGGQSVGYNYTSSEQFNSSIAFLPDSRSSGTPWVKISQSNAIKSCQSLQMAFLNELPDSTNKSGFQLISNTQWQVVARNIENAPSNWSGNALGNGKLNKGISNGSLSASSYSRGWAFDVGASNPILDSDPYFATSHSTTVEWNQQGLNPPSDSDQKRTHRLSNGQLIWDFSGNVFQWVSDARSELGIPVADEPIASVSTWYTFNNAGANRFSSTFILIFGSLGIGDLQHATEKNLGELFGGSGGFVARGGEKGYGESGLYATTLFPSGNGHQTVGFRCVYSE